jgi:hypothetical protein
MEVHEFTFTPGEELKGFLDRHPPFGRVIYVGDGSNDFCPALRLRGCVIFLSAISGYRCLSLAAKTFYSVEGIVDWKSV